MKHRQPLVSLALAALLTIPSAYASEIYRFVDENGEVHYVDRPTGAQNERQMAISSRPTDPAAVQARAADRYSSTNADELDQAGEDEEDELTRSERRKLAAEREKKCMQYREQLETYVTSRRLYRETDNGEREYLDDDERMEARSRVEQLIKDTCDS